MKLYRLSLTLFAFYNLYYSIQLFSYSTWLFTTKGFLISPYLPIQPDTEIWLMKCLTLLHIVINLVSVFYPFKTWPWLAEGGVRSLILCSRIPPSIGFPPALFCCIGIAFANQAIKNKYSSLLYKSGLFIFLAISLSHFIAGLAKLYTPATLWLSGNALEEVMRYSIWRGHWYLSFLPKVPHFVFITLNYFVLFVEIAVIFMFPRRLIKIGCLFIITLHLGNFIFMALEEISAAFICAAFVCYTIIRLWEEDDFAIP